VGAARLAFRHRWAILSAARIYGAIARKVAASGAHAWDHRIHTGRLEKAGHVLAAFGQACLPAPRQQKKPRWNRRMLASHPSR